MSTHPIIDGFTKDAGSVVHKEQLKEYRTALKQVASGTEIAGMGQPETLAGPALPELEARINVARRALGQKPWTSKEGSSKKDDLIAKIVHQNWVSFQMGAGKSYNAKPTKAQLDSQEAGTEAVRSGEVRTPAKAHAAWVKAKIEDGWMRGPKKDEKKKEHPRLVPYAKLPDYEKRKDKADLEARRFAIDLVKGKEASAIGRLRSLAGLKTGLRAPSPLVVAGSKAQERAGALRALQRERRGKMGLGKLVKDVTHEVAEKRRFAKAQTTVLPLPMPTARPVTSLSRMEIPKRASAALSVRSKDLIALGKSIRRKAEKDVTHALGRKEIPQLAPLAEKTYLRAAGRHPKVFKELRRQSDKLGAFEKWALGVGKAGLGSFFSMEGALVAKAGVRRRAAQKVRERLHDLKAQGIEPISPSPKDLIQKAKAPGFIEEFARRRKGKKPMAVRPAIQPVGRHSVLGL